ncbi:MAG: O-antigen ligase family protein [Candidatus Omnitrophica bacterium]|nr:O-antigen ligase family protein [Candidatus Omnitrophota bacterium]
MNWLILYIGLLPLMVVRDLPIVAGKIQLSEAAFLVALIAVARELLRRRSPPRLTPVGYGLALFVGVSALSAAVSLNVRVSLVELMAYGYLAALYLTLVNAVRTWPQWLRLLECWVIVSSVVALLGVLGMLLAFVGVATPFATRWEHLFLIKHPFWAASSTFVAFPTPAMVYGYLHVGTLLALGFACGPAPAGPRRRLWYGMAVGIHLAAILCSYSRGWVALLLSTLVFLWQFRSRVAVALSHAVWVAFLMTAVSNELLALYNVGHTSIVIRDAPAPQPEDRRYFDYLEADSPLKQVQVNLTYAPFSRMLLRRAALAMFRERPWLGVGPGNFPQELHRRQRDEGATWGGLHVAGPWDPHSTYLGLLAEGGLAGFGALLGVLGLAWWQWIQVLRAPGAAAHRCLLWALLSSLVGYAAFGWYDDLLTKRWVWFAMGLGGAAFALARPRVGQPIGDAASSSAMG